MSSGDSGAGEKPGYVMIDASGFGTPGPEPSASAHWPRLALDIEKAVGKSAGVRGPCRFS